MRSVHAIRWIENLRESDHELFWFDILNRGKLQTIDKVQQYIEWKRRKIPYLKGEYFLSKRFPSIYDAVQPFLEVTASEQLEKIIEEIQPDVIHSFEMQNCCYPILKTMQKYPNIKWMYSCWGSDLFYYRHFKKHNVKIKEVLQRVDFLHTDCQRDFNIAQELGFKGKYLGVIPGGGGFHLEEYSQFIVPVCERKIIVVKGYQHHVGRGLVLVKALQMIQTKIQKLGFNVVVFGAHQVVIDYVKENQLPYQVYDRHELVHQDLLQLMGKSALYLGNSLSDGMPNTLLEAISMGAFPIQSNPGDVTAEIVTHGENGYLIENPDDGKSISRLIMRVLQNKELLNRAFVVNQKIARNRLSFDLNQQKTVALYQQIAKDTCV